MRLFDLLGLMDGNERILVKKGDETLYIGIVDTVPNAVYRQDVIRQTFYSDGGSFRGIRFEVKPDVEGE